MTGRTWKPIFDDQPTGSVGDIVVSLQPQVIYGAAADLQRPDLSVATAFINQPMAAPPGSTPG